MIWKGIRAITLIGLTLLLFAKGAAAQGEREYYYKWLEILFPETKAWVDVQSLQKLDFDSDTVNIGEIIEAYLQSERGGDEIRRSGCSFIARSLVKETRGNFRMVDLNGDGLTDVFYSGQAMCSERNATVFWLRNRYGFTVKIYGQNNLTLRLLPGKSPMFSGVSVGCCADDVDVYYKRGGDRPFWPRGIALIKDTVMPEERFPRPVPVEPEETMTLRSWTRVDNTYDVAASHLQGAAVFGNALATYIKGAKGEAIAGTKDGEGQEWLFIVMREDDDVFRSYAPYKVNGGWVKKSELVKPSLKGNSP